MTTIASVNVVLWPLRLNVWHFATSLPNWAISAPDTRWPSPIIILSRSWSKNMLSLLCRNTTVRHINVCMTVLTVDCYCKFVFGWCGHGKMAHGNRQSHVLSVEDYHCYHVYYLICFCCRVQLFVADWLIDCNWCMTFSSVCLKVFEVYVFIL